MVKNYLKIAVRNLLRHKLYSLINIGVVTYYHGQERSPATVTYPQLSYPDGGEIDEQLAGEMFADNGAIVNIRRDLQEIQTLTASAFTLVSEAAPPWLAILDQRLLYWPTGVSDNTEGRPSESSSGMSRVMKRSTIARLPRW